MDGRTGDQTTILCHLQPRILQSHFPKRAWWELRVTWSSYPDGRLEFWIGFENLMVIECCEGCAFWGWCSFLCWLCEFLWFLARISLIRKYMYCRFSWCADLLQGFRQVPDYEAINSLWILSVRYIKLHRFWKHWAESQTSESPPASHHPSWRFGTCW